MDGEKKRSSATMVFIVGFLLLPVLYVLSLAPLIWLDARGSLSGHAKTAAALYASPVRLLHENGPIPVHDAIDWYVKLWTP